MAQEAIATTTTSEVDVPAPDNREADIKAQQSADRKAARASAIEAAKAPAKKATGTSRAKRIVVPKAKVAPKATPAKKANAAPSKADRVRTLLDQGKSVREISQALDDVTWAYAWDIAAAYEKKTGKVFIPSHAPKATPR